MTTNSYRLFLHSCVLVVLFLPSAPAVRAEAPSPADPHSHFRQADQCSRCHLYAGTLLSPARFSLASVEFCQDCHLVEERGRTHPMKVRPGERLRGIAAPRDYPLSDDGKIICLTCHRAHGPFVSDVKVNAGQKPDAEASKPGGPAQYKTYYLRRSDPKDEGFDALCGGCHRKL